MSFLPPSTSFSALPISPPESLILSSSTSSLHPHQPQHRQSVFTNIDQDLLLQHEAEANKRREAAWSFGHSWLVPMGKHITQAEEESEDESAGQEETPTRGAAQLPTGDQNGNEGEFEEEEGEVEEEGSGVVDLDESIEDADADADVVDIEASEEEEIDNNSA